MFQVIIPMSGFGERFRRAGYTIPKPLIPVHGKPIIQHVVEMFPGVADVIFICNRDHLDDPSFKMHQTLDAICPDGQVVAIEPHKLGPVHAMLQAEAAIDPERPTVINYCDFTCYWDFAHFRDVVTSADWDGAIPAYTGFHPHMLGSTNYAYVREQGGVVLDIQEKQPFTDQPMSEYASSGTYYFRSGGMALDYCRRTVEADMTLGGEYYASLVYKPMLDDGRRILVYPLQHFMQWGTPEDLADYQRWSDGFERLCDDEGELARHAGTVMVPMAGAGSRFVKDGYLDPKPLIPVSGQPMAVQATRDLPESERRLFVQRRDLPVRERVEKALTRAFDNAEVSLLDQLTDGQARTCLLAMDEVDPEEPLTIGACDNGVLYDPHQFQKLMAEPEIDVIVWVTRGHPNAARDPEMYGWIAADGGHITGVSVKEPLDDPQSDPVIIGTFTFKRASDFNAAAERMFERGGRINGEFYVDSCIEDAIALGLNCVIFEVDAYLSWGTPDELRSFEYWQSCFHKWPSHPYRLERDRRVPPASRDKLDRRYAGKPPKPPKFPPSSGPFSGNKTAPDRKVKDREIARPDIAAMTAGAPSWTGGVSTGQQLTRFVAVGLTTVAIDYLVYLSLLWLGMPIAPAKGLGFVTGALYAYVANGMWTFNVQGSARAFAAFVGLYLFSLGVNVTANQWAVDVLQAWPFVREIAFVIATGLSATINFLGLKFFVFHPAQLRQASVA
ncbi:MAG: NTP transferase domain-containing protein [Pseudomonadota bacterium]